MSRRHAQRLHEADGALLLGQQAVDVREDQPARRIPVEVRGCAMDQAAADGLRRPLQVYRLQQFVGRAYAPEGECSLQAHQFLRKHRGHAGLDQFPRRLQAIVAAENVRHLRVHLPARADQHRQRAPVVVRVLRHDQALHVEHLQRGEFGVIADASALNREVGEQD